MPDSDAADLDRFDQEFVRGRFPALAAQSPWALFDNAGGSVPLGSVVDRTADYMRTCMVQLGASYRASADAAARVAAGHRAAEQLLGCGEGEAVVGPSATILTGLAAQALRPLWQEGDEIIVTDLDHEANVGAWRKLERTGIVVKEWRCDSATHGLRLEHLEPLLTDRTRLVAFTHCSNLVGEIQDVAAIAARVRSAGALSYVDGVAFAPHRRIDVQALGVDCYLASFYKVYGPHLGGLFMRRDLLDRVVSQNHFFVPDDAGPYKLEPGNVNHELTAALPAVVDYLQELDRHHGGRGTVAGAFEGITQHEQRLAAPLLEFLHAHPKVRLLGRPVADEQRAPTVSFTVAGRRSAEIPPLLDERSLAIRFGHFYAHRFCTRFGLHDVDGVVRISMVHYNTPEEVTRLVAALGEVL